MNRTLKRVLGLTGSVVVGLAGAVTFASAAQAHHTNVTGAAECLSDGTWQVTWSVTDWNRGDIKAGTITEVISSSDAEITGDFAQDSSGIELPYPGSEDPLKATQILGADVPSVSLGIAAEWDRGDHIVTWGPENENWEPTTVDMPEGGCEDETEPEEPVVGASAVSDCFAITVTAVNENPEALAEFTFTPSEGEPVTGTPEVDEPLVHSFLVVDPDSEFSVAVTANGEDAGVFEWEGPADCPVFDVAESCEGLTFDVEVPAEGAETTFTVVTSEGGEHSVTVAPGESGTIEVPVEADSITVEWSYTDGKFIQPGSFDWEKPVCEEETTPAADEQLPTTGSSMTIMISAAAALVVAAAVLFFIARRRRAVQDW